MDVGIRMHALHFFADHSDSQREVLMRLFGDEKGARQVTVLDYMEPFIKAYTGDPVFELPGGWGFNPQLFA
jgi:hypothetical protein